MSDDASLVSFHVHDRADALRLLSELIDNESQVVRAFADVVPIVEDPTTPVGRVVLYQRGREAPLAIASLAPATAAAVLAARMSEPTIVPPPPPTPPAPDPARGRGCAVLLAVALASSLALGLGVAAAEIDQRAAPGGPPRRCAGRRGGPGSLGTEAPRPRVGANVHVGEISSAGEPA